MWQLQRILGLCRDFQPSWVTVSQAMGQTSCTSLIRLPQALPLLLGTLTPSTIISNIALPNSSLDSGVAHVTCNVCLNFVWMLHQKPD